MWCVKFGSGNIVSMAFLEHRQAWYGIERNSNVTFYVCILLPPWSFSLLFSFVMPVFDVQPRTVPVPVPWRLCLLFSEYV